MQKADINGWPNVCMFAGEEITRLRAELATARNYALEALNELESDLQKKALWLRGEQAYREFPGFAINRTRDAKKAIRAMKGETVWS